MLVWSTHFPILPNHSTSDLLGLCKRWVTGSPHSTWKTSEILDADDGNIRVSCKDTPVTSIEIGKIIENGAEHCGFRHQWHDEDGRGWVTEICGFHAAHRFFVGIHLHCSTLETGVQLPKPKKPYIVRQILDDFGGDLDADFLVDSAPKLLLEAEVDVAMRLLQGKIDHHLPVVYVSSTWDDCLPFNIDKLARSLGGMAHVIAEPSRRFSFILADRIERLNPYEGTVAICWPKGAGRQTRLFRRDFRNEWEYAQAVEDEVRSALARSRPDRHLTWSHLQQLIVRRRIRALREQGKSGLDEYAREFDHELELTKARLEEAENENAQLKGMLARRTREDHIYADGAFKLGTERDLFPGEHKDIIALALKIASTHVQQDGRIRDVLNSLIKANPPSGESERIEVGIKTALTNCNDAGPKERKILHDLGFSITEEGKHLKLLFRGDDRYTFAMSKTGSDWRGMRNWISDVSKRLFK